ncbi:vacuolar protein sorting-associated protein 26-domain-containing protein [Favolaschia claudopus]|uniref:Vacuolar protein sorting-associated protein 26-domain-containing protein n=1 Tax=Favolaschia claudopus TaxID=2862362 RepID=A0AAW0CAQ3_9AGAR
MLGLASLGVDICLTDESSRERVVLNGGQLYPLYCQNDVVQGDVVLRAQGGQFFDNERTQFLSLVQELSPPGELVEDAMFQFSFNVDEKYESYLYLIRATIKSTGFASISKTREIREFVRATQVGALSDLEEYCHGAFRGRWDLTPVTARCRDLSSPKATRVALHKPAIIVHVAVAPSLQPATQVEWGGVPDSLHFEVEIHRPEYSVNDIIVGQVRFLLMRMKVKKMELSIIQLGSSHQLKSV